jgi:hypothetical protein
VQLVNQGFFKERRTVPQVQDHLKTKLAANFAVSSLQNALNSLLHDDTIVKRTKTISMSTGHSQPWPRPNGHERPQDCCSDLRPQGERLDAVDWHPPEVRFNPVPVGCFNLLRGPSDICFRLRTPLASERLQVFDDFIG